jgi:hypothetical protein
VSSPDALRPAVRFLDGTLPLVTSDERFETLRWPDELLHAVHPETRLRADASGVTEADGRGTLYVSSHRLVHAGQSVTEAALAAIEEMAVALDRLLLIRLTDGSDLAVEIDRPRLLRAQIATALAAAREQAQVGREGPLQDPPG